MSQAQSECACVCDRKEKEKERKKRHRHGTTAITAPPYKRDQAHSSAYLLVQDTKSLRRRPRVSDIPPLQWQNAQTQKDEWPVFISAVT